MYIFAFIVSNTTLGAGGLESTCNLAVQQLFTDEPEGHSMGNRRFRCRVHLRRNNSRNRSLETDTSLYSNTDSRSWKTYKKITGTILCILHTRRLLGQAQIDSDAGWRQCHRRLQTIHMPVYRIENMPQETREYDADTHTSIYLYIHVHKHTHIYICI